MCPRWVSAGAPVRSRSSIATTTAPPESTAHGLESGQLSGARAPCTLVGLASPKAVPFICAQALSRCRRRTRWCGVATALPRSHLCCRSTGQHFCGTVPPEKSADAGLRVLRNFSTWNGSSGLTAWSPSLISGRFALHSSLSTLPHACHPAIDLKDGRCVRLRQGDMDNVTVFSEDPAAVARHWVDQGATRLHLVDLNGAFRPANRSMKVPSRPSSPKWARTSTSSSAAVSAISTPSSATSTTASTTSSSAPRR